VPAVSEDLHNGQLVLESEPLVQAQAQAQEQAQESVRECCGECGLSDTRESSAVHEGDVLFALPSYGLTVLTVEYGTGSCMVEEVWHETRTGY
jgi:hypothetical protein